MTDYTTVKKSRKSKVEIADCIYYGKKNPAKMRVGGCRMPKNKGRVGIADCIYNDQKKKNKKKTCSNEGRKMSALKKIRHCCTFVTRFFC